MSEQTAERAATVEVEQETSRRPFRAADVLTGTIDKRRQPAAKTRKQISAQLDPNQLRILGELHARLNATAEKRIEKSDLVGLGIELLAAVGTSTTSVRICVLTYVRTRRIIDGEARRKRHRNTDATSNL
jgi:hypothetical protein